MKTKRKIETPLSDGELFNLFSDFSSNELECERTVSDAKRAFTMLNSDKLFRGR